MQPIANQAADRKEKRLKTNRTYEAPKVLTFDNQMLMAALGPSISCTGFGGAVDC